MNWIFIHSRLDDARLDAEAFRVLANLARRADQAGKCFPSIKSIASDCRMNKKTVVDRIAKLVKTGWLMRESRHGQSTVYRLPLNPPDGLAHDAGQPIASHPPNPPDGSGVNPPDGLLSISTEGNPLKVIQRAKFDPLSDSPIPFDSPEFTAAWSEWVTHRREIKKAITPSTAKKQLALLASLGEPAAIASIESSIANGWTGLFPPKTSPTNHPQTQTQSEKW